MQNTVEVTKWCNLRTSAASLTAGTVPISKAGGLCFAKDQLKEEGSSHQERPFLFLSYKIYVLGLRPGLTRGVHLVNMYIALWVRDADFFIIKACFHASM